MSTRPTRAQAIKKLLELRTHPDLAALYHPGMEVQVNVGRDGGKLVESSKMKKGKSYTDGQVTWYPFRIPKNAMSEPEDNSGKEMTYPLSEYAEAIGMTGWDFLARRSIYFAYDFDDITGHSEKHKKKLTDAELDAVRKAAMDIPWVTVRRSTAGKGLHLYVFLKDPAPTKNHNEHAALGRAILSMMSALAGFDFDTKVDACGGNMWVWARKMKGTPGLEVVKLGEPLDRIPENWRSHVKVIRGERKKSLPDFVEAQMQTQEDADAIFDELAGQHPRVKLDEGHKKLITWLQEHEGYGWWDGDHHMLVTHTFHLARAHEELGMKGTFKTNSPATQVDEQNCFCFPMRGGSWAVRRYSMGAAEDPSWEQDGKGYTRTFLNREPDLRSASKAAGGVEHETGGFMFKEAEMAADVARKLGADVQIDAVYQTRQARLKPSKDGKQLVFELDYFNGDPADKMPGWYPEKGKWKRILNARNIFQSAEAEVGAHDDTIRHAVTESRMDAGWFIRVENYWNHEPKSNVQDALIGLGRKKAEVSGFMGASVLKPWVITSRPFQDEYPGDRLWNRDAVQYRYPRTEEQGEFPHWTKVLKHVGKGLDEALAGNGWALANGITTGEQYLILWLASVLQNPYAPLPYLFLYSGNQNTGKSIFHEMIRLLITDNGLVEANGALMDKERFNDQLEGKVICYIEEMNLKKNKQAYERIKNWVTSPNIMIAKRFFTPYAMPNVSHWIHCANDFDACPIFPGDTRITMISVPDLSPTEMIPKGELMELLRREAPHFLNYLLSIDIPVSNDRLRIPVVNTSEKEALSKSNRSSLEEFIEQFCCHVPGKMMLFSEFYEKFYNWLDAYEQSQWPKNKVTKGFPPHLPTGTRGGQLHIANLSWEPKKEGEPDLPKLIVRDKLLIPAEKS